MQVIKKHTSNNNNCEITVESCRSISRLDAKSRVDAIEAEERVQDRMIVRYHTAKSRLLKSCHPCSTPLPSAGRFPLRQTVFISLHTQDCGQPRRSTAWRCP